MDKSNDWYTHRHPMIGSHTEYDDKHLWNKEQTDNQWLFQIKKTTDKYVVMKHYTSRNKYINVYWIKTLWWCAIVRILSEVECITCGRRSDVCLIT